MAWPGAEPPTSNKRRTLMEPDDVHDRIKRLRIAGSDAFDAAAHAAASASGSSPPGPIPQHPHPGLARAWAHSQQMLPGAWPPGRAMQPLEMHACHLQTPIQQQFAQLPMAGYSPHTQALHGHGFATAIDPSMGHQGDSPYRTMNSMLGQLHAERVAAGARASWHEGDALLDPGGSACMLDPDDDL